jgi:hypothetical protein
VTIKLERREMPQEGIAFVVMPHGSSVAGHAADIDFDDLYDRAYAVAIGACGMRAVRADRFDDGGIDALWPGLQAAEVVIVDCSVSCVAAGVALGLSMALGKRLIMTAQQNGKLQAAGLRGQLRPLLYPAGSAGAAELARALESELRSARTESGARTRCWPESAILGRPSKPNIPWAGCLPAGSRTSWRERAPGSRSCSASAGACPTRRCGGRTGKVQLDDELRVQVVRVRRNRGDWGIELREVAAVQVSLAA